MRARWLRSSLVVPGALATLVVALGVLQYRWLGQVSEAERQELRASIDRRARDFTTDFNRQIGGLYGALRDAVERGDAATANALADVVTTWQRTATFPGLVAAVYESGGSDDALRRLDLAKGVLEPAPWPEALAPLRQRLTPAPVETVGTDRTLTRFVALDLPASLPSIPALVLWRPVPLAQPLTGQRRVPGVTTADVLERAPLEDRAIIVHLDREYLTATVIPALAARHLGAESGRVEIRDGQGRSLWTRGHGPGTAPLTPSAADAALAFFVPLVDAPTGPGADRRVFAFTGTPPRAPENTRVAVRVERQDVQGDARLRMGPNTWQLLLQHPAGSLDLAVAEARRRNLWLSFGILAVLTASMALVLRNARRAEQLAAQQLDFVATVSHELRTPVAVIRSAAQNLAAGIVQAPDQARRYGELIDTEGRRLTDMVEQVLEYAGIDAARDPSRWSPVDVGAIARDVAEACAPLAHDHGVEVEVHADAPLPPIDTDERGVRRALENLVVNAVRHAAGGRWVGVTVRHVTEGRAGWIRVTVSDRGDGIDGEDLPHVFEPFYRGRGALDRQVPGSGLGLSLVKRFATVGGGRVSVTSAPSQGTTFTLDLPVHRHEHPPLLQTRHA